MHTFTQIAAVEPLSKPPATATMISLLVCRVPDAKSVTFRPYTVPDEVLVQVSD